MQIHQLNDFVGALGASAFLPVDNGTDTGKVAFTDLFGAGTAETLFTGDLRTGSATLSKSIQGFEAVIIYYQLLGSGTAEEKTLRIPTDSILYGTDFAICDPALTINGGDVTELTVYKTILEFTDDVTLTVVSRWYFGWDGTNTPDMGEASFATTKITRVDGIRMPANSTGVIEIKTATLSVAGWSNKTQTVSVENVTPNNSVLICPAPTSQTPAMGAGVYCSAQGNGTLTFKCGTVPSVALDYNIMVVG